MLIDLGLMLGAAAAITIGLDAAGVTDKFTRLHKRSEKDEKEDMLNKQINNLKFKWLEFFTSSNLKGFKVKDITKIDNGYKCILEVPVSKSVKDIANLKESLENYFCCTISIKKIPYSNTVQVNIFDDPVNDYAYIPVKVDDNHLFIGKSEEGKYIILKLKLDPHIMFAGSTGKGKSYLQGIILTNLMLYNKHCKLYLHQIGKSELDRYKNCKQVKALYKDACDSAKHLKEVVDEINKRADKFAELGIADIEQYNQVYGNKLPRIFEVFDEISCYKVDGTEEDEAEETAKKICWANLWKIVKMGRSVGIHFIGATQRITAYNLGGNGDLKSCLTMCCLQMRTPNDSILALGDESAVNLQPKQAVLKWDQGITLIKVATLDEEFKLLHHYIPEIKIFDPNANPKTSKVSCEETVSQEKPIKKRKPRTKKKIENIPEDKLNV